MNPARTRDRKRLISAASLAGAKKNFTVGFTVALTAPQLALPRFDHCNTFT